MGALEVFDGCYEARRAAALSGVPLSTVYDWARKGVVVPSVSEEREKLWSYADLTAMRIVYWLRHPKEGVGTPYRATTMSDVREAFYRLAELQLDPWRDGQSPLKVDPTGRVHVVTDAEVFVAQTGQREILVLDLLGPFDVDGSRGPDLIRPRPHLRIVPGKVAGEPHIEHSRVTTQAIAALRGNGLSVARISALYPDVDRIAIEEAVDLERDLGALVAA